LGPALDRHVALIGFMGAAKSTLGAKLADRLGRPLVDTDAEVERAAGASIADLFERGLFREVEERVVLEALDRREPGVLALGGGAVTSEPVRRVLRERALTALLEIDPDEAWRRVGGRRPLAQDAGEFRRLYEERRPLYVQTADATAADLDDLVLAAGAVSRDLVPRQGPVELVADSRVLELHPPPVDAPVHAVPPGEEAKSVATAERLWRELRLERGGTLVAFGGGCTTDVAGFVAATYLRGVDWIAVPTTLVGQVDAAIGGKTAINLPEGKNLVGAFHWPVRTVLDPSLLATLPPEQRAEGMAEVVKTGLLAGEPLWELDDTELVRRCAAYKTAICLRDPFERGPREQLNLGHTFAHALEAASGYGEVTHGRAVALGLLAALRLSGLDTGPVEETLTPTPVQVDRERAWEALRRDKKSRDGRVRLVLLEAPGKPVTGIEVPDADVRRALDELITD
jgi:shikimate kinase/3-dehydroquinate synthase